jgi:CRISPR type IV-associated protein Csf2
VRRKATLDTDERESLKAKEVELKELKAKQTEVKSDKDYKNTINTPVSADVILPGMTFSHQLRLRKANDAQLGCLLDAMRRFSVDCTLGGLVNRGCGLVEFRYQVVGYDEKTFDATGNPERHDLGEIVLKRGGFAISGSGDNTLADALAKWDDIKSKKYPDIEFKMPTRD